MKMAAFTIGVLLLTVSFVVDGLTGVLLVLGLATGLVVLLGRDRSGRRWPR